MKHLYSLLLLFSLASCMNVKSNIVHEVKPTGSSLKITNASFYESSNLLASTIYVKGLSRHVVSSNHRGDVTYEFYDQNNELIKQVIKQVRRSTLKKNYIGSNIFKHTFDVDPNLVAKIVVSINEKS